MRERWPRRGEIWWLETPSQPHDPDTPGVALIHSANRRNHHKDDYIVVPAFSHGNLGPTRVFLPEGEGGIDHDSILFFDEVCCPEFSVFVAGLDALHTKDAAERSLRPLVIARKISWGTGSALGSISRMVLYSIGATARRQGQEPMAVYQEIVLAPLGTPSPLAPPT